MGRLSRGCLRCRERRVRCDEGRPSCERCINRNEVCQGYRDEATIIFRHETVRVIEHARASAAASSSSRSGSSSSGAHRRSRSVDAGSNTPRSRQPSTAVGDLSNLTIDEAGSLKPQTSFPWVKQTPGNSEPSPEDRAVNQFLDKYVLYPCNQNSSPGFLEHLPCLFKDVNIEGRYALRYAMRAAAYADASKDSSGNKLALKALECYSLALDALGGSLSEPGKVPDDYDLMTIVVLDIFESLFLPESARSGVHAQGMAQILRLRGSDQIYNSRGWSLFRLAHHRIQKQQLAFGINQMPESQDWLGQLNDDISSVRLEKDGFEIKKICNRAQELLEAILDYSQALPPDTVAKKVEEMLSLDEIAVGWRRGLEWNFTTMDTAGIQDCFHPLTSTIELHADVWNAYEWNYHRTARIICHQQLLKCLLTALGSSFLGPETFMRLDGMVRHCRQIVHQLADGVLSTVPQSLGDVDHMGRMKMVENETSSRRAIGGYLLLWPIKIIKDSTSSTSPDQKHRAQIVFDRIREYTGMKSLLGDMSII